MLIKAKTVAFEDVIYHYRQHSASITKKISAKFFDTLITDKMLENLFSEHFGHDSRQKLLVSQYRMKELIAKRAFLFRIGSKLQADERKKIREMIKEHYMALDRTYSYTLFEIISFCRYFFAILIKCRFH